MAIESERDFDLDGFALRMTKYIDGSVDIMFQDYTNSWISLPVPEGFTEIPEELSDEDAAFYAAQIEEQLAAANAPPEYQDQAPEEAPQDE